MLTEHVQIMAYIYLQFKATFMLLQCIFPVTVHSVFNRMMGPS